MMSGRAPRHNECGRRPPQQVHYQGRDAMARITSRISRHASRILLPTLLLALGCSRKIEGPTPTVSGAENEHDHSTGPALLCNAQGDPDQTKSNQTTSNQTTSNLEHAGDKVEDAFRR